MMENDEDETDELGSSPMWIMKMMIWRMSAWEKRISLMHQKRIGERIAKAIIMTNKVKNIISPVGPNIVG